MGTSHEKPPVGRQGMWEPSQGEGRAADPALHTHMQTGRSAQTTGRVETITGREKGRRPFSEHPHVDGKVCTDHRKDRQVARPQKPQQVRVAVTSIRSQALTLQDSLTTKAALTS